jgi:hypothetical protein
LIETFGLDINAEKVHNTVNNGTYFTEGSPSQGVTIKFILDKGSVRVESTGVASGLQRGSGGRKRAGRTGSGDGAGAAGASETNGQGSFSLAPAAARAKKRASLRVKLTREALTDAALSQASWKEGASGRETLKEHYGEDADLFQKLLGIAGFHTIPAELTKDEVV